MKKQIVQMCVNKCYFSSFKKRSSICPRIMLFSPYLSVPPKAVFSPGLQYPVSGSTWSQWLQIVFHAEYVLYLSVSLNIYVIIVEN